ncbi:polysaccharide pyruvyl transferase family protein [Pseudomonas sp. BJa3]|uniref:polysaccharide pyruvyl transferase family protein n=1 Tax=Pseudomonas sp. BJa3 TaxID=2986525 RepID=UPI0022657EE0|nr:polysaccharide pyruvyl transferase family protein [Pseudomonas sp. BJa3]MCX5510533.1 polysaccharide pyruvyl transferase family protein [Pseudomonas sp. BJa3]
MLAPTAMKYGLITNVMVFGHLTAGSRHNIGDDIQTHAVEHLYACMGIPAEQIVRLNRYEFHDYDGRHGYILMPMCGYFTLGNAQSPLPLSPYIIPVYFSFGLSSDVEEPADLEHFRRHEPIGTRDERVMHMFRERGISAFTSGCLTITFPLRQKTPEHGKVFLVDVPDALLEYVPVELADRVERVTHMYPFEKIPSDQEEAERFDAMTRELCQRYADEGALVVTSRLHCAAPCIAMGIPTIVVAHNISDRFAWLDRYVRIYTEESFSEIDWQPVVPDIEQAKQMIRDAAARQIEAARARWAPLAEISTFYETRERSQYNHLMVEALDRLLPQEPSALRFAFWGANTHGVRLSRALREMRPGSELVAVVDEFLETKRFCGVPVVRSSALDELREAGVYVFISTYAGRDYALSRLQEKAVKHGCLFDDLLTFHALS